MNANGQPPPTLQAGESIPYLTSPIIGRKRGNKLVALGNGLLRARIVRGAPQDGIYITPQGILFALADSGSPSGTGSVISMYKITAVFGDYVVARTWDGTTLGQTDVFIAKPTPLRTSFITDGTSTFVYSGSNQRTKTTSGVVETQTLYPTYDVNEVIFAGTSSNGTSVSQASSVIEVLPSRAWFTASSSALVALTLQQMGSDCFLCVGGLYVAKSTKLRNSIASEVIDGTTVFYTYDASFVARTGSAGLVSEPQIIVPRFLASDVIYAMPLTTPVVLTFTPGNNVTCNYIDINIDGRAWSQNITS